MMLRAEFPVQRKRILNFLSMALAGTGFLLGSLNPFGLDFTAAFDVFLEPLVGLDAVLKALQVGFEFWGWL